MTNGEKYKSAKERAEAFCHDNEIVEAAELLNVRQLFGWLDLEAPADEPLPCPFCGAKVHVKENPKDSFHTGLAWIMCGSCGYSSSNEFDKAAAIAAHNRVARAVNKEGLVNK